DNIDLVKKENESEDDYVERVKDSKRNHFTTLDFILIAFTAIVGLLFAFDAPLYTVGNIDLLPSIDLSFIGMDVVRGMYILIFVGLLVFIGLTIYSLVCYNNVVRDLMIAVILFAFFTIFFLISF